MRYAIVSGNVKQDEVANYLPKNYSVIHQDRNGCGILIAGEDDHGWTMDDYIIPRLASGMIVANEVWPVFTNTGETGPVRSMDVPPDWLRIRKDRIYESR